MLRQAIEHIKEKLRESRAHQWLFGLFCLNALLRIWGIGFGHWSFDEEQNFDGAVTLLKTIGAAFTGGEVETYTPLVTIYGVVGKYLCIPAVIIGKLIDSIIASPFGIPTGLVLSRISVSFLPNVLSIYLTDRCIKLMKGGMFWRLLSMACFLAAFKHMETAHYAVSDSLSTFFAILCVYQLIKGELQGFTRRRLLILGVVLGAAIGSKINVGLLCGFISGIVILKPILRANEKQEEASIAMLRLLWLAVFFLAAFALINLPYILNFSAWQAELIRHIYDYPYTIKGGFLTYLYFHPPFGVVWLLLLSSFGGMALHLYLSYYDRADTEIATAPIYPLSAPLLFLLVFYLYLAFSRGVIHRWAIPMTPCFVLFGSYALQALYTYVSEKLEVRKANMVLGLTLVLMLLPALWHSLQLVLNLSTQDTYTELRSFVATNLDPSTTFACYEGVNVPGVVDKIPNDLYSLENENWQHAIITPFWFSEDRYPDRIIDKEVLDNRAGGDRMRIRMFLRREWGQTIIQPTFYTPWSTNVAQSPPIYIYSKPQQSSQ